MFWFFSDFGLARASQSVMLWNMFCFISSENLDISEMNLSLMINCWTAQVKFKARTCLVFPPGLALESRTLLIFLFSILFYFLWRFSHIFSLQSLTGYWKVLPFTKPPVLLRLCLFRSLFLDGGAKLGNNFRLKHLHHQSGRDKRLIVPSVWRLISVTSHTFV